MSDLWSSETHAEIAIQRLDDAERAHLVGAGNRDAAIAATHASLAVLVELREIRKLLEE